MARNSDILGTGTSVYAEMNAPGHVCNRNESTATPPCMPPVHPTSAALSKMKAQPMVHRLNWTLAGTGNCHTVCPRAFAPPTPAAHITLFIPVVLTLDESVGIGAPAIVAATTTGKDPRRRHPNTMRSTGTTPLTLPHSRYLPCYTCCPPRRYNPCGGDRNTEPHAKTFRGPSPLRKGQLNCPH